MAAKVGEEGISTELHCMHLLNRGFFSTSNASPRPEDAKKLMLRLEPFKDGSAERQFGLEFELIDPLNCLAPKRVWAV